VLCSCRTVYHILVNFTNPRSDQYHVAAGRVPASQVVTLSSAGTVQGEPISIRVSDGSVILNGTSRVVQTDIQADNGIIHVIDSVLLPPSLAGR
jgi:uncharacterized surface protein with fasciclin (FAS1) repeats